MKSIFLSIVAASLLWIGGAFTSTAEAQYVRYGRGYYNYPRYARSYYYGPRYYQPAPYRTYYRGDPYYGGRYYYNRPYYGGGYYYRPGVSVGVGPARVGIGF